MSRERTRENFDGVSLVEFRDEIRRSVTDLEDENLRLRQTVTRLREDLETLTDRVTALEQR